MARKVLGTDSGLTRTRAPAHPGRRRDRDEERPAGTVADSHVARATEFHVQLTDIVEKHKPVAIVLEAYSPPKNATTAAMLAWQRATQRRSS